MRFFPSGFDRSTAWMQENRGRERVGENAFDAYLRQGLFQFGAPSELSDEVDIRWNHGDLFPMRLLRDWLAMLFLLSIANMVHADEPRTLVKGTPRILGREIEQIVLVSTIHVGGQVPGMITMPSYYILPNRFAAVSEDSERVYYQAVTRFRPETIEEGGLWISKTTPGIVYSYLGNAGNPRVPLHMMVQLNPEDVRKLKLGRSERHR
jgi:hypothetical protein